MHSSEVNVGGTAYRYKVDDKNALTVWRVSRAGDAIVGRGRVWLDGARYKITESSDALTAPIMFAIEQHLSGFE